MPPSKNKRRAEKRKAAQRKQQQMAIADSPSNPNPTREEVEGETEEEFHTPETEVPLRESRSGSYLSEDVGSRSNGQERLKEFKLAANGDRNANLDVRESRWEEFCKEREELCKESENFGDTKLNESVHVIDEESRVSEQIVSCDDKQVQVLPQLDEKLYTEDRVEDNGNLNTPLPKNSSIFISDNSNNADLAFASKNKDMSLKDSKVNESARVIKEESDLSEEIFSDNKKQVQVSSQMDEQIYPKDCVEVNGNLDATIQKKHPVSSNGIASENSIMKTKEFVDAAKEKVENEDIPLKDSTEAIGVSSSNERCKDADIISSNVETIPRLAESSIPVCGNGDTKERPVTNSLKETKRTPSVIKGSKDLIDTNQEIQPRADFSMYSAELHKPMENNSKFIDGSDCEEEASNRLAFGYLDKQKEEIHSVNENFDKPIDAVGEKTLAAMMKIQLDQSPDQNARLDENSSLVPEETKHGKSRHGSLESLIKASDNLCSQTAEEFAESSSSTGQSGNMQSDKVDSKEAGRRTSFLKCCGLLEAFTGS